jgi:glycosyltransferase involved in cell wall biosynthesis
MEKLPVSVFIIAKNEEARIKKSIQSVSKWAAEVIVIDSGSDDNTVALSESLGARVIYNKWEGYVAQKVFGEQQCKYNWILNIDADEEVSVELAAEIKSLFINGEPQYKAYICRMVIVHRFDKKCRKFAPETNSIRFYHIAYAGFKYGDLTSFCHDSVILNFSVANNTTGRLKQPILHRSLNSITQAVEKANFYSSLQAQELFNSNRCPTMIRIFFEPVLWFFKAYFLRRYFVFGFNGVVDSYIFAFTRMVRLAKARELFLERDFKE